MYTQELIDCIMKYFEEEYEESITEEIAVAYLNSLADLFNSAYDLLTEQKGLNNCKDSGII
jgi:hypothetical protein